MKQPFTKLLFVTLLLTAGTASAQSFWSEDFANGIPAGWTNVDSLPNGVLWEECAGPTSNCVNLFGQTPFASTTADNGFVLLDSDGAQEVDHVSRLTTDAIDCSAVAQVFASFENYVGIYNIPSTGNVLFKVSTDGINWTAYDVVPGLERNDFSANPHVAAFDISAVAANQAIVYLQWEWTGRYEYWWMLDDIVLTTQNPTPNNDLVLGEFFYPVSSYATPASQIATDTFGFYALVSNRGAADQPNVELFALVLDGNNNILFQDSASIDLLPAGYSDTLIQLPNRFVPTLNTGMYTILYVVSSDSTEARPDDNVDGDFFEVTDNLFAKERGPTTANRPGSDPVTNLPVDYAFANLYQMSSASMDQYRAVSLEFSAATDSGTVDITDLSVSLYLFKVMDDVLPDFSNFDETSFISPSLEWLAFSTYDYPATAENFVDEVAPLSDLTSGESGVALQPGARYLAAVEYTGVNNVAFHSVSEETSHYFLSSLVYTDATGWFSANSYGANFNPVIRMNIDLVTSVDERPLSETALQVLPNPIQSVLNLQVGFDQATDATITLAEISGRVIKIDNRKGLTNEMLTYEVPQLANGVYLARIATKEGTSTKRFVVQK